MRLPRVHLGVAFILLFAAIITGCSIVKEKKQSMYVILYYVKKDFSELQTVKKNISFKDEKDLLGKVITALKEAPDSGESIAVTPKSMDIIVEKNGTHAKLFFPKSYEKLDVKNKVYIVYTFVKTLTGIQDIRTVEFYVDNIPLMQNGESIGRIKKEDIVALGSISPNEQKLQEITLYFANKDVLVSEDRMVKVKEGEPIAKYIIQELIKGPMIEGLSRTVPANLKLTDEIRIENGTCYISFNKEFITQRLIGQNVDQLIIYSIVNSLTELKEIDKVQFLIEGQKENYFGSVDNFNNPFERNIKIIKNVLTK